MDALRGSDFSCGGRTRSTISGLKRKPFSDLTNAPSSSSSIPIKSKPKPKPRPAPDPKPADPEPALSTTAGRQENDGDLATSTSTPRKDVGDNDKLDTVTVSRQPIKARRKDKEKAIEAGKMLSCPPLERKRSIDANISSKDRLGALHKALSATRERPKKRKLHHRSPVKIQKPMLPPDFIEKQREYFAQIDAFELPEEEVSDSELD